MLRYPLLFIAGATYLVAGTEIESGWLSDGALHFIALGTVLVTFPFHLMPRSVKRSELAWWAMLAIALSGLVLAWLVLDDGIAQAAVTLGTWLAVFTWCGIQPANRDQRAGPASQAA